MGIDLLLMEAHVATLFVHDDGGRLCHVNDRDATPAPRFFLGRTREGHLARVRRDLPADLRDALLGLCRHEPVSDPLLEDPAQGNDIEELLEDSESIRQVWSGPAYHFPDDIDAPADTVRITPRNLALLDAHFAAQAADAHHIQPLVAVVEHGRAVALCWSARTSPEAAEAGIETVAECRGRGCATRALDGWALAVRRAGRVPLFSTSWDNAPCRGLARRAGLIPYGADFHVT